MRRCRRRHRGRQPHVSEYACILVANTRHTRQRDTERKRADFTLHRTRLQRQRCTDTKHCSPFRSPFAVHTQESMENKSLSTNSHTNTSVRIEWKCGKRNTVVRLFLHGEPSKAANAFAPHSHSHSRRALDAATAAAPLREYFLRVPFHSLFILSKCYFSSFFSTLVTFAVGLVLVLVLCYSRVPPVFAAPFTRSVRILRHHPFHFVWIGLSHSSV